MRAHFCALFYTGDIMIGSVYTYLFYGLALVAIFAAIIVYYYSKKRHDSVEEAKYKMMDDDDD